MTDLLYFEAKTLTAHKADRTFRATLLPYGELGSTSLGKLTASRTSVKIPKDPSAVVGRLGHDNPDQPAASQATQLVETDTGLMLAGRVLASDEGDQLLAEIDAGERNMVSVEVANPVIRDGQLVDGTLYAYAHVAAGAFASAKLVAEDHGDLDERSALRAEAAKYRTRLRDVEAERDALKVERDALKAALTPEPESREELRARLAAALTLNP